MNNNFKVLLIGTSLSLIPQYAAAQCAVTDCQQLGYTSLQKCDNGLKCPFGEYWACPKVEEKAVLGQCTGYAKNCKIGDILNSDGTCTTDKVNGKSPLGVVLAIKENCGWAMTAKPIATMIEWGDNDMDISALPNYTSFETAIQDYDSCGNTLKIIQAGNNYSHPAAWKAYEYVPSEAPETKGKWCLPALGMLHNLILNLETINNAIGKLEGKKFTYYKVPTNIDANEYMWSSSEYDNNKAWAYFIENKLGAYGIYGKSYRVEGDFYLAVRPVIEF